MKEEKNLTRREMREKILEERSREKGDFRRGKTISRHQKEHSERSENQKLVIRRRKLGAFFVILAIFISLISIFLFQFISKVSVVSNESKSQNLSKYEKSVEEYLNINPSERILSNLNKNALLESLQKDYPEVLSISDIKFNGLTSYKIYLDFRKPVASWLVDGKEFFVDSEGVSFNVNNFEKPSLNIIDDSGAIVSNGKNVASGSFFSFIGKLVSAANKQGLEVSKIRIPPLSLRQVEVSVKGVSYFARMSTADSAEGQIINFKKAIEYFRTHKISPNYIDLRIEGKGYYK
jgi:hypothetical protein